MLAHNTLVSPFQDDAGARTIKFCLDHRVHGTKTLAYKKLSAFQGTALLVYNDGVFSERDFESISRIGDSCKREQVGKTGRFGWAPKKLVFKKPSSNHIDTILLFHAFYKTMIPMSRMWYNSLSLCKYGIPV